MEQFYLNKYRVRSIRLKSRNYGKKGLYYITICTKGRQLFLGQIVNGQTILSQIGQIAEKEWLRTPTIRPDMNIQLGEFVIMPNHIHAIIKIGTNIHNDGKMHLFEPGVLNRTHSMQLREFAPQYKNLASIVRGFKSAVTMYARLNNIEFDWLPRYHDQVIRHGLHYSRIRKYILDNPKKWEAKLLSYQHHISR